MTRRLAPWAAFGVAFVLIGSCGREPTGLSSRTGGLVIAPRFADAFSAASAILDFGVVRVLLTRPVTEEVVVDTTIPFPASADSLVITLQVEIEQTSEPFTLRMAITNAAGDTVFRVGPASVIATANPLLEPSEIPPPVYVGVGSDAVGVRFVMPPFVANFGEVVPLIAEAFDGADAVIPGTPIGFELVSLADTTRARFLDRGVGSLTTYTTRGAVAIRAYLLTEQSATHTITVQPVANAMQSVSGNGQVGLVGALFPEPVVTRVIAADNLGVVGIPVDFRLIRGTDTLAVIRDTSDASGLASFRPTFGTVSGAHAISATALLGASTAIVNLGATAMPAAAARLEFTGQPTNVLPLATIAPAVVVTARDAFGNAATAFTGNVTVEMLDNPLNAVLAGTLTRAAVGGVATFADLSLTGLGTGLTLRATASGVASDTSATFDIAVGSPARVEFIQQPGTTTAVTAFTPPITVAVRDAGGTTVPTATDVVTLTILTGPGGAVLAGPTAVAAVGGVATFAGVSIARAGAGYTLLATAGALVQDTSATFSIAVGPPTQLTFLTQPPATIPPGVQMNVQVAARDAGGNLATSFAGSITVAIGNNPGSATLGGTLTSAAEGGIAAFGDLTLDNLGTGYTLVASAAGLTGATSNAFDVAPPPGVNSWINLAGGDWNTPSNWSTGAVPTAGDTVWIKASGTYTVQVSSGQAMGRVEVGGGAGVQTLLLSAGTMTLTDSILVASSGALQVAGASLSGTGDIVAAGAVTWAAGSLSGNGSLRANGPFLLTGSTPRSLSSFTLEVGFTGTWDGDAQISSGSGAVLRVLPGAILDIRSTGAMDYNLGGVVSVLDVLGSVTRSLSADTVRVPGITGTGSILVSTGVLQVGASGVFGGTLTASAGAEVYLAAGASTFAPSAAVNGAGIVTIGPSANVNVLGGWSVSGATRLIGGVLDFDAPAGATGDFVMLGGTKGGSGLLEVTGLMTWTAGSIAGGGGTTRVLVNGDLTVDGAAARTLSNHVLELAGDGVWTGTRNISSGSGAILRVLPSGNLELQGGGGIFYDQGGIQTLFEVQGNLSRTVSTDTIRVAGLTVLSGGSAFASTGVLEARNNGTSDGSMGAFAGGELRFAVGTQTLTAASNVSGSGVVSIGAGGTVSSAGNWAVTGTTRVNGGTLDYDGLSGSTANFELLAGIKGGSGNLFATATLSWTGGSFQGGNGATQLNAPGTGVIGGTASRTLSAHSLAIGGSVTWSGSFSLNSGSNGSIRVIPGGMLDIQGDPTWQYDQGGAQSFFEVQGAVTRSASPGVALVPGLTVNGGTLTVASGVLEARNDGTSDGTLTASGGELRFTNGTQTMTSAALVNGAGIVHVSGGGTVTSVGGWAVTGITRVSGGTFDYDGSGTTATFELTGGVKGGSGTFGVTGAMTWSGGSLSGGSGITRLEDGGTISIQSPASRSLGAHTLEIGGTGTWSGAATFNSGSGGTIRVLATGLLDIQGDPQWFYDQGGAQSQFEVLGIVTRTVSSGTAFVPGLSVSGALTVSSGVMEARNTGTSAGAITVAAPGELRFASGTHTLTAASSVGGSGTVTVSAGSTTSAGAWAVTGTTQVAGGTFDFNGATGTTQTFVLSSGAKGGSGTFSVTGPMTWSGGNISGDGGITRVAATGVLGFVSTSNRALNAHALEILGTATWTDAFTLSSGSGAVLRVGTGGVLNIAAAPTFAYDQGGAASTFENLGTINVNGPGTTIVTAPYQDVGATNVAAGATFDVRGGGSLGGAAMALATGGTLRLGAGSFSMQPTLNVTGDGLTLLDGATLTGLTAGDTARIARLQANAGQLGTDPGGVLEVNFFDWSAAATLNGGGEILIPVGGTGLLTGTVSRTLSDHTIAIAGSVAWVGNFLLNSGSGASIRVLDGGGLTIQPPVSTIASYLYNQGGAVSTLVVEPLGAVLLGADATFNLSAQLQHSGTTSQLLGNYNLSGGGTLGGVVFLDTPANLSVAGGTLTLADTLQVLGPGQAVLSTGTLTTAASADTAEFGRLRLDGGTVDPLGTILVSDHLEWAGASSITGGTLVAQDTLEITGTLARTLIAATLETQGVTLFSASILINSGSVARIRNMPTGSFEWSGNGDYLSNQGGGQSVLENRGQLQFTGTGLAQVSAYVVDTTSNSLDVQGGTVESSGGGRLGGVVQLSGGILQVSNATFSLKEGTAVNGGTALRVTGGTLTMDTVSAGGVFVNDLELAGGQILHEGLLTITNAMIWSAGELESNTVGATGTTRIASGATLAISGATTRNLISHALDVGSTSVVSFDGSGNLQTGSGATIQNAGLFDLQGTGSVLWSLGGSAPRFRNLAGGTLQRSGATAGVVMNLPLENAGGTLGVVNDTLRLTGGSVTAFTGTAVAAGGPVKLLGTYTMTGNVAVTGAVGDLVVNSGSIVVGPNDLDVAGDLVVNGTGSINSTDPAAFIDVVGDASFSGNPTNLSNGILRIGGNFAQGPGGNFAAFTATANHQTYFSGTARQTVSFANPGIGSSRFATVDLGGPLSPRRLELLTNVFAGTLRDQSASIQDTVISATNALLTTANAELDSIVFVGNRLTVTNGADAGLLRAIRFDLMDVTATQLQVDLNAGATRSIINAVFATTPTTGYYVTARQMATGAVATLSLPSPVSPAAPGTFYQRLIGGGSTLPSIVWNGVPLP